MGFDVHAEATGAATAALTDAVPWLTLALVVFGVTWMWRVGRRGPRVVNALAETAVIVAAFPAGLLAWAILRRRDGRP